MIFMLVTMGSLAILGVVLGFAGVAPPAIEPVAATVCAQMPPLL
jgi:hypothetical protein